MYQIVLMFHVVIAIAVIGLVLIQHGKGADIGAAFGSGASNTVFGSQGTGNFLFKLTGGLVLAFFVTSLALSSIIASQYKKTEQEAIPAQTPAPVSKVPVPADTGNTKN
jgi:preprotein translocase subunit SecG